ncbi:MAG: nucleotide exchange factor GrpE [Aeromicrobium sp.]|uniref:nucleotide exchange factor GrpE n=1 Tax=Aeromicrobium sp. TaxID=1871063 RepID=UPI0039E48FFB
MPDVDPTAPEGAPEPGGAAEQAAAPAPPGGEPTTPVPPPPPVEEPVVEADPEPDPVAEARKEAAERTADLQRLQAEYLNYKRRVERDREVATAQGEAKVLESLLTVLDDVARADQHGELTGGFKAVADALQSAVAKHGLETFGVKGEPFDPALHEAVTHAGESPDVEVTSLDLVMRTGFRVGDRVLRTAVVAVVDPASTPVPAPAEEPVPGPPAEAPTTE